MFQATPVQDTGQINLVIVSHRGAAPLISDFPGKSYIFFGKSDSDDLFMEITSGKENEL